jgi:hypothetical protein
MRFARIAACSVLLTTTAAASPALAWWQFVSLGPNGLREVHSPYKDEAACQAALKKVEARMKKQFPDQFPLVGSCEEYRGEK